MRAVLAGVADATPKSGEGEVEMIRMFKSTKDSAVKARTQAINQMKALVVTARPGFVSTSLASPLLPCHPGPRASGLVVWRVPPRRPSMLFPPLPVATVNSVMR